MRTLAVDYGTRRIGVAVSDALGITARGVTTLRGLGERRAVERVAEIASELDAEAVVVGLPVRADGSVGDAAARVLRFVERLEEAVAVPVHTVAEWLTSYEAEERMREMGIGRGERRRRIDEAAAVVILEEFLAARGRERETRRDG
jgi:putative Holliday junction resolvase